MEIWGMNIHVEKAKAPFLEESFHGQVLVFKPPSVKKKIVHSLPPTDVHSFTYKPYATCHCAVTRHTLEINMEKEIFKDI